MVADLLERVGALWGDQREYLTCPEHGGEYVWDDESRCCPVAGCELHVHVPHGEHLMVRYLGWKLDQRWWPQRFYSFSGDDLDACRAYWRWLGREWRSRPVASIFHGIET